MCSAACLTGEEEQSAPDTKQHHRHRYLANLRKPHGLSKKQYSTAEEGQLVICGLF